MLPRKFSYKTNWLNFPKGVSPNDEQGIKFAEMAIRQLTGADRVQVSFDHGPDGMPLLEQMRVSTEYPVKQGSYLNTAELDKDKARLLGEVINALAGDGDAKGAVQKLLQSVESGGVGEEGGDDEKPQGAAGDPKKAPQSGPGGGPSGPPSGGAGLDALEEGGSGPANAPSSNKPRLPFAGKKPLSREARKVKAQRTSAIQNELGVDFKQAAQIYRIIESSANFNNALPRLKQLVVDENDRPLSRNEYVRIAKVARGETAPLA